MYRLPWLPKHVIYIVVVMVIYECYIVCSGCHGYLYILCSLVIDMVTNIFCFVVSMLVQTCKLQSMVAHLTKYLPFHQISCHLQITYFNHISHHLPSTSKGHDFVLFRTMGPFILPKICPK